MSNRLATSSRITVQRWGYLLVCVLATTGCEADRDRAFRAAVIPVLRQAASLETLRVRESDRLRESTQFSSANSFVREVDSLPRPRDKALRFLAWRLKQLARATRDRVYCRRLFLDPYPSYIAKFLDRDLRSATQASIDQITCYQTAASAERVALGTSILWDAEARLLATTSRSSMVPPIGLVDSLARESEKRIRLGMKLGP